MRRDDKKVRRITMTCCDVVKEGDRQDGAFVRCVPSRSCKRGADILRVERGLQKRVVYENCWGVRRDADYEKGAEKVDKVTHHSDLL